MPRSCPIAYYGNDQTLLTELDVSLPGRPRIVRNLRIDGTLRAARGANGLLRLVVTSYPNAIVDVAERGEVAGWVPSLRVRNRRTGRIATRQAASCTQISRPATYGGLGLMTVLTIDPARSLVPIDSDALMANVGTVYATGDMLYVASSAVYDTTLPAEAPANSSVASGGPWTIVHAFGTSRTGTTELPRQRPRRRHAAERVVAVGAERRAARREQRLDRLGAAADRARAS